MPAKVVPAAVCLLTSPAYIKISPAPRHGHQTGLGLCSCPRQGLERRYQWWPQVPVFIEHEGLNHPEPWGDSAIPHMLRAAGDRDLAVEQGMSPGHADCTTRDGTGQLRSVSMGTDA